MLALFVWIIVSILSIMLFKRVSGSLALTKPNLVSLVFYYSLFVSSYIGSLLIVLDIDHYYMINKLDHESSRYIGFAAVSFVMVVLPLTMLGVSKLANFNAKREFADYLKKPVANTFNQKNEFYLLFLGISIISMLAVAYTLLKTNQVPLFELLKGNFDELGKLRIDAARNFNGNVLIRNIFAIALTPLLSLIAYVYTVKTKQLKWFFLFLALFGSAILISIYDLSKSPIFFYIIMFIFVRIYIGKTVLTRGKIIALSAIGAVAIVFMYVFIQGVKDIDAFLSYSSGPIGRIILAQIAPTFLHFDIFGDSIPFLHGSSLPSIITGWFDVEQVRSARLVMANVFPNRIADGTGGVLNTLFIAEAYANFGYLGVIFGTIYVGIFVQLLYIIFIRLPKNPIFLCLFIYFSINIPRTLVGGFADFLFNPIWLFITCLFAGMLLFIRFRLDLSAYFSKRKAAGNER
ncbi:oligosaccharide repeat unit polymerase [Bacillus sp. FJAT-49705]|uniref:Oligosaccharide repeat unit polymerase n=1 Tax=Cytobacillus citreus TaxID=2833586 RepID=A0ABS5NTJ9_9BACI|nr:O-antigen polymerase [Cytobacillus citreus]MBS4190234.1 oligosaccharide repeat unit polymerase [Cytobacillus citreus]